MKKLLIVLLSTLFLLTFTACKNDKDDKRENANLEVNSEYDLYLTTYADSYQVKSDNELEALKTLDDNRLEGLKYDYDQVKYAYVYVFKANTEADGMTDYLEENVNLGLCFNLVRKDKTSEEALPTYGYTVNNLTPSLLYIPKGDNENYEHLHAKSIGDYLFVCMVYKDGSFNLALKDNVLKEEDFTEGENGNDDDYKDYLGEDKLPDQEVKLATNIQDGVILHAWNWSYKVIEENLEDIKNAGYSTIQVSPIQQPKDYKPSYGKGWATQWWKLYQPVSLKIAEKSWLGTAEDLTSLCTKAHELGLFIIADIVVNHVGGLTVEESETDQSVIQEGKVTMSDEIEEFDPELYEKRSSVTRPYKNLSDSNADSVTKGNMGMPDLKTEDKYIQERVSELLVSAIDCGVDGFRFDAAKHIETPEDGASASNFWPTVLKASDDHAKTKNKTMYYYGEILNTVGGGRSYNQYTKYMTITDNKTGNNIRNAVVNHNAKNAASSSYVSGVKADKVLLWAESHDTYANKQQESTKVSESDINKTWAMVAARKDATALYFARPIEMGSIGSYAYKNSEVVAVNKFHNEFIGANEDLYADGNFSCVERYTKDKQGIVIANVNGNSGNVNVKTKHLADGTYYDQVSGAEFQVKNGVLAGKMNYSGVSVITKDGSLKAPIITLSQPGGFFSNEVNMEFNFSHTESAMIEVNGSRQIVTEDKIFKLGKSLKSGEDLKIKVSAINGSYRVTREYTLTKLDGLTDNSIVISDVPAKFMDGTENRVFAWVWVTGKEGRWVECKINGKYLIFEPKAGEDNFLLAVFKKAFNPINSPSAAWKQAVYKTKDTKVVPGARFSFPEDMFEINI